MFLCYYIFNLEYGSISTDFVDYCIFKLQDGGTQQPSEAALWHYYIVYCMYVRGCIYVCILIYSASATVKI